MANPKLAAKVTEVLGYAPEDAVLMLPRDGQNWVAQSMDKGPKKFSIGGLVADAIVKTEVRPGGHVLGKWELLTLSTCSGYEVVDGLGK